MKFERRLHNSLLTKLIGYVLSNCSFAFTKHEAIVSPEFLLQLKPLGRGFQNLEMYQRRLYLGTSTAAASAGNSDAKRGTDANSAGEGKSGGSDQSSEAGKPIRGGVRFHSFTLFF